MTVAAAARALSVSRVTIYTWLSEGRLWRGIDGKVDPVAVGKLAAERAQVNA